MLSKRLDNYKILFYLRVLKSILNNFVDVFLVLYFLTVSNNNILPLGIYRLISMITVYIVVLCVRNYCKSKGRIKFLRIGIILYFALILLTITLNFQFLTTLKFKEYFNYKKVFKTIISNIKSFIIYIFKIIVIIIAVVLIDLCITIPIGCIFGVSSIVPIANPAVSTSNAIIISSLIATIIGGLGSIITLDLTGQFVRIIFPREKQ